MSSDTPFVTDLRALLAKHNITAPRFAYGSKGFNAAKPQCLYSGPMFDEAEIVAATAALVEGKWSVAGEYVHRFESEFSKYLGQAESVMVNSGSSADLILIAAAKRRFGWADGDGVIVSPCGFPTTVSAITLNGLTPVFIDIEWSTLNADNTAIEQVLKRGEEMNKWKWYEEGFPIRAIFVSPVLGNPPDIDKLVALAERYNVKLLLDGCDSLGSKWRGEHLASYAVATTCSFFPSHHMSTLQGGMISSNDTELIRVARQLSTWGRACYCAGAANLLPKGVCGCRFKAWLPSEPDLIVDHKYIFEQQGYNLQPLDLQGAIGLEQLKKLDTLHAARKKAWTRLLFIFENNLDFANDYSPVTMWADVSDPSWFGFGVICETYEYKRALVAHLEANGIQTRNYFAGNILQHPGYQDLGNANDYPNSQQVLRRVFFIGTNPGWTNEHFNHIEKTVKSFNSPTL